ncbi:MAG: DUF2878 domain-containing protein [Rhizobiales bacterium]|nr:DUF2878 domain-containing protein [Hyphomicrobiales bacterium]
MLSVPYPKWLNFILFQSLWFAAILGREQLEWLVVLLLALHIILAADLKDELRVVLLCAAVGVAADTMLTLAGVFIFDPAPSILPVPFWLIGIWLGFAGTFRHSMSYLLAKPMIAIPAAAVAAPLSYLAGMKLGAVSFGLDIGTTAVVIGLLWACMMALFIHIVRADRSSSPPTLALT